MTSEDLDPGAAAAVSRLRQEARALRDARRSPDPRARRSGGLDVLLGTGDQPAPPRILVFTAVRKTGCTTLRALIAENYPNAKRFQVRVPKMSTSALHAWFDEFVGALEPREIRGMIAVSAHTAGYFIPRIDRPVQGITMLREPIDRALSYYYFSGSVQQVPLEDLLDPDDPRSPTELFNGQARTLMSGHYDLSTFPRTLGPPPDADVWRARLFTMLAEHYVVGVREAYAASVSQFARMFGWTKLDTAPRKVNASRPREIVLDRDTYELLRAANWLDFEVYQQYARTFEVAGSSRGYSVESRPSVRPNVATLTSEIQHLRHELLATQARLRTLERLVQTSERASLLPVSPEERKKRRKPPKAERARVKRGQPAQVVTGKPEAGEPAGPPAQPPAAIAPPEPASSPGGEAA